MENVTASDDIAGDMPLLVDAVAVRSVSIAKSARGAGVGFAVLTFGSRADLSEDASSVALTCASLCRTAGAAPGISYRDTYTSMPIAANA